MGWLATSGVGERGSRKDASTRERGTFTGGITLPAPALKRTLDTVGAATLLGVALPLLLLIAAAIKLDSRGPVLYRVRRVGYHGRTLMMLKFRKMYHDAQGIPLTADADERLTRVGKVLARTRLDELPQLWDVVRGRMSMVGPRPEDPGFVALHADEYQRILSVRPGITGLSQLAYAAEHRILRDDDIVADYLTRVLPQKIALDTLYADSHQIRTDVAVIWWTVITVILRRPVAVHRTSGRMNLRKRARAVGVTEPDVMTEHALAETA